MRKDRDIVWAIFLIFLGSIFLLNTTGVLSWDVWRYILNYWPVLLILGGLKMILGSSIISTVILSVISFLIFLLIGLCTYTASKDITSPFLNSISFFCNVSDSQSAEPLSKEINVTQEEYPEIEELNYDINLGISEFTLTDDIDQYLKLNADYTTDIGEPELNITEKEEILNLSVKEKSGSFPFINLKTPEYDIKIGSDLLSDILIDNGVGSGKIELSEQFIRTLSINTGTGDIDLFLGFNSIPTENLNLDIGTGSISLTIPNNVGYEIDYNVGVGEIRLGEKKIGGIGNEGEEIKSENFDTAEKTFKIKADVGVGSLDINFNN
jgi:predicted membrane protein